MSGDTGRCLHLISPMTKYQILSKANYLISHDDGCLLFAPIEVMDGLGRLMDIRDEDPVPLTFEVCYALYSVSLC